MPLSAGDKLGPYEILSPLGAGGMGEVYKARDTRLDRSVAIKVLAEPIAKRADFHARFEREARMVASLNHPNICVLHDIGSQGGAGYMVMELLEGETLAARIRKGAIPLEQALALAAQIGDALDRAHRAGVTHRDVKPGNIMLTRDGVKVLDFGLAKSAPTGSAEETLTAAVTSERTVVGTPQYMAPELFQGGEADARADIWAFGEVLYEMLTGQKAFQGKSYPSLVGAILTADPPPMAVKPFTPAWLERLVRRCLQKDPEDRYQSMRDVVLDLRAPAHESAPAKPRRWVWAVAAVACLAGAVAGWTARRQKPVDPALPAAFEINPPEGGRFLHTQIVGGSAISPDGRKLAFAALTAKGEVLLHVRPLESLEARALPGTDDAEQPFWSPDSRSLAFAAGGKLKRIDVSGGSAIALCDVSSGRGGSWNEDGVILFGTLAGLKRITTSGGTPSPLTELRPGEIGHGFPRFLPGGRQFLYLVLHLDPGKIGIYAGSLDGKQPTKIAQTHANVSYDSGSGRLLYLQEDGALMAQRLELDPPRLTGDAALVLAEATVGSVGYYADFSVSSNGTLFYGRRTGGGKVRFAWRDRAGKILETIGEPFQAGNSTFETSPDGGRVAYAMADGARWDTWILDLTHGRNTRFTFSAAVGPRWTADGQHIYLTNSGGLWRKAADGSSEAELVLKTTALARTGGVSPDGKYLLYETNGDIWMLPLTGERQPAIYLQTDARETWPTVAPDGRWIAYESDETGRSEIYVQGFPERRGKWLISAGGGRMPIWRPDGKELYWRSPNGMLMAAGIDLDAATVRAGKLEPLFRTPGFALQPSRNGRRFLVQEPAGGEQAAAPMVVQPNWAARLGK